MSFRTSLDTIVGAEPRAAVKPLRLSRMAVIALCLLAGLLALGIVPRVRRAAELRVAVDPQNHLLPVSLVVPRPAPATTDLDLPGNIQAIRETPIYARTNGYLRQWFVDIGDRVEAGKVLAVIDTPELDQQLSQARAQLAQAQASLAQSEAGLQQARANTQQARASFQQTKANLGLARVTAQRWNQLVTEGAVARQDADEKQSALDAAQANTEAAQANVDAAQANVGAIEANVIAARANVAANEANVRQLKALQSFQRVTAPYAGIITARTVDRGALITAGSGGAAAPLFRMAQIDTLRIFVNVPQTFVRSIAPGQEVQILVPEYPKRPFGGRIASTAGALDPTSRTLLTEVRLRNDDHALLPGMYAQVKFSLAPAETVWIVPATALLARSAGPQVVDVRRDGTVHYLGVQLGRDLGQSVEVVVGLTGGERLVLNPPDGLKEGMRVAAEEPKRN